MKELSKNQLKKLRKLSHSEKPLFQMGKLGLTDVFLQQLDQALEKRELVKFHILQNSDESLNEVTEEIAKALNTTVVQLIGNTAVLYRPSSKAKHQVISQEIDRI